MKSLQMVQLMIFNKKNNSNFVIHIVWYNIGQFYIN